MTIRLRSAAAAALLLLLPSLARAQGEDARVLPRGWVELRGTVVYQGYESRFVSGGTEPLGAAFTAGLQPLADSLLSTLPTAATVNAGLTSFFTRTAAKVDSPRTPAAALLGTLRAGLAADVRRLPLTVSYGLTSRIMLGVTVPFEQNGTSVTGIGLHGGTLGVNPAVAANRAVLTKVDSAYAALGGSALLPTAGSPAGIELQRRVRQLTGDTLQLPAFPLSLAALLATSNFPTHLTREQEAALSLRSAATKTYLADVEVGARVLLAGRPGYAAPDSARLRGLRSTLAVNVRLPTGPGADTLFLLVIPRATGHFGWSADLHNDVFLSRRFWGTVSGGYTFLAGANVLRRPFSADEPFPGDSVRPFRTLRMTPGAEIRLSVLPRYRLTREWSFAAAYSFQHVGATSYASADSLAAFDLGPVERTDAMTAHMLGLGASYTTIPAFLEGRTPFPLEFSLLWRKTVAGSGYAPQAGTIEVGARMLYQAFGRPPRARRDTAATDTARALPPPPPPSAAPPSAAPPSASPPAARPATVPPAPPPSAPPPSATSRQPTTGQPATGQPTTGQPTTGTGQPTTGNRGRRPAPPPPPPSSSAPPPV